MKNALIISGEINRIEDWYCKAGPKDRDTQWRDDYSAKEFARLWFGDKGEPEVPDGIRILLARVFGVCEVLFAIPEHKTRIDEFRGEPRNHDMFLYCRKGNGDVFVVCIEAKVAEPLDETVGQTLESVQNKRKSNVPERIDGLKNDWACMAWTFRVYGISFSQVLSEQSWKQRNSRYGNASFSFCKFGPTGRLIPR